MWFKAKKKNFHKIERNNCGLCGHNTDPSPGNHVVLRRELCLMDAFAREIWSRFLALYHTERWRVSIESWSCRWTVSRSNPSFFVLLCVSPYRCYPLSLCASLYGFPPLLLACGPMTATASVEQTWLSNVIVHVPKHAEMHGHKGQLHVLCLLACHTANNHELSRQPRIFTATHQNMRRGGVQCLAGE